MFDYLLYCIFVNVRPTFSPTVLNHRFIYDYCVASSNETALIQPPHYGLATAVIRHISTLYTRKQVSRSILIVANCTEFKPVENRTRRLRSP